MLIIRFHHVVSATFSCILGEKNRGKQIDDTLWHIPQHQRSPHHREEAKDEDKEEDTIIDASLSKAVL